MKILKLFFVTFFTLLIINAGVSAEPIKGANTIGVVVMHGKGGTTKWVDSFASSLESEDIQVLTPDMPWHEDRIYDKSFEASMLEIQDYVNKLKAKGATKIFLAGHSMGAVASAGYAAQIGGIQGIILLAPGHFTNMNKFKRKFVGDLEKASSMIDSGKGNETSEFGDLNMGSRSTRDVTASIYKSWFSPVGPAEFVTNMKSLKNGISVLYVAGSEDRIPKTKDREYAFDKAPANDKNQFTIIDSGHLDVPDGSSDVVKQWLSSHFAAGPAVLKADKLKKLIIGHTAFSVHLEKGFEFQVYFDADGKTAYRTHRGDIVQTTYSFNGNQHCIYWKDKNRCATLLDNADGTFTRVTPNGKHAIKWTKVVPGKQL